MRNTHEIQNYFHPNIENTKLKCDICNASYEIQVSVTNLKKHFAKYYKTDYQKILEKQKEKFKNIKEINQILPYNGNKYYVTVQDKVNNNTINEFKNLKVTNSLRLKES
ncbi:22110_t:CDS:2, partial [Cetraspora pellucida]